jgi:hypothetical protein
VKKPFLLAFSSAHPRNHVGDRVFLWRLHSGSNEEKIMKKLLLAAALVGASTFGAFAQTTTPTTDGDTPAVATPDSKNATAPVEGANSFTEEQAKERITEGGYADVTGLALDDKGVWQGKAMKDGKSVNVALDYQGNIVAN